MPKEFDFVCQGGGCRVYCVLTGAVMGCFSLTLDESDGGR